MLGIPRFPPIKRKGWSSKVYSKSQDALLTGVLRICNIVKAVEVRKSW